MKRTFNILVFFLFSVIFLFADDNLKNCNSIMSENTSTIKFIPKEFENIDFESVETEMCPCSPNFTNDFRDVNTLKINIPEKIFFHISDEKTIPVCIAYSISSLRWVKYYYFSQKKIHIKHENYIFNNTDTLSLFRFNLLH